MIDNSSFVAASSKIGDLAYLVALQNARVMSDDPAVIITTIFNALVISTSKAIAVSVSGGTKRSQEEWSALVGKVQHELMLAAQDVMLKNAPEGFSMAVISPKQEGKS